MTYFIAGQPRSSPESREFRHRYRTLRRTIGANIVQARLERHMGLKSLSGKTGIRLERLDHFEIGRAEITLSGILRIAVALRVPLARLLNVENPGSLS